MTSGAVGIVARISYQLQASGREAFRPPYEVMKLMRKLAEYTELVQSVQATLLHLDSTFFGSDRSATLASSFELADRAKIVATIARRVENIFYVGGDFRGAVGLFTWMARRRRIMDMVDDLDGLKTDMLILLQVAQMENDREMFQRVESSRAHSLALLEHWVGAQGSRVDA